MTKTEILNVFITYILLALKVQEVVGQEEFLDDEGRYIFNAPPSIRNRQKQFNAFSNREESSSAGQPIISQNQVVSMQNTVNQIIQPQIQQFQLVPTTVRTTTSQPQNSQLGINLRMCIRSCPTTSEFNPVCGSDGISYSNAQKLFCSQRCGQAGQFGRFRPFQGGFPQRNINQNFGFNNPNAQFSSFNGLNPNQQTNFNQGFPNFNQFNPNQNQQLTTISPNNQLQNPSNQQQQAPVTIINPRPALTEQVRNCLRACPTTNEYNPVCGSDQISYGNMQKLQCALGCGQSVTFVRQGRCAFLDRIQN